MNQSSPKTDNLIEAVGKAFLFSFIMESFLEFVDQSFFPCRSTIDCNVPPPKGSLPKIPIHCYLYNMQQAMYFPLRGSHFTIWLAGSKHADVISATVICSW